MPKPALAPLRTLADVLLPEAPSEVHDALAPLTSWVDKHPVDAAPRLSDPVARAVAATRPAWARMVAANPDTAPATLAWIAERHGKDPQVRSALSGNPATPAEILQSFVKAAALAEDMNALATLATVTPAELILSELDPALDVDTSLAGALAARVADLDRETARRCLNLTDSRTLRTAVATQVATQEPAHANAFTMADLLEASDAGHEVAILVGVINALTPWTDATTDWFASRCDAHATKLVRARRAQAIRTATRYQANTLVRTRTGQALAPWISGLFDHLDADSRETLVSSARGPVAMDLLTFTDSFWNLSDREVLDLAGRTTSRIDQLRTVLRHERAAHLSDEAVVALLGRGDPDTTAAWIQGLLRAPATTRAVDLLAQRPGRALGTHVLEDAVTIEEVMLRTSLLTSLRKHDLDSGAVAYVLDQAASRVVSHLVGGGPRGAEAAIAHLQTRLRDRFGTHPCAWETFVQVAPQMPQATLGEMFDAVAALTTCHQ